MEQEYCSAFAKMTPACQYIYKNASLKLLASDFICSARKLFYA